MDPHNCVLSALKYQYASLQPQEGSFRLLKLLRYKGPELECELSSQSLSNNAHDPYEALSYVWGSCELVECIILNGKQFWITDNLYSALQYLRLRDRDRYLWIDAICINQADKEEQSRQVQQMGQIFRHAEKVLFWLGKATLEIMALMDALNQLHSRSADQDSGQWSLVSDHLEEYRTGLRQLLNRQWFTRVWIIQEVANAQDADVCCGNRSIPAEIFARAPSLLEEEPASYCQAILDIMPGSSRTRSWWAQEPELYTLLRMFRDSKATDERDKIYALLGLSSNSLDIQNIDIDYQRSTAEVVNEVVTYLLGTTVVSVHEVLNFMTSFATLNTSFFVPQIKQVNATEIISPHRQSGRVLKRKRKSGYGSGDIAVGNNPALFLFENRPDRNSKYQETCYNQALKLMLNKKEKQPAAYRYLDSALHVISWGRVEQQVKIVMFHDKTQAVCKAAMHGCDQIVKQILQLEVESQAEEKGNETVDRRYDSTVRRLPHQDTCVKTQDRDYGTALLLASSRGYKQIVKLLIDAGVDVNTESQVTLFVSCNALQAASSGGYEEVVKLLLNAGVEVSVHGGDYGITLQVASLEDAEELELLLSASADVNVQGRFYSRALEAASTAGHEMVVKLLLNAGADVNVRDAYYGGALYAAVSKGHEQIVKLLLDRDADCNARGLCGSVIEMASSAGQEQIVKLLLDKGANISNALQSASARGHKQVVQLLLEKGADVNAHGPYGSALWAASSEGHEKVVKLLLNAGAHVNTRRRGYGSALQAASSKYHKKVVKLLLNAGAYTMTWKRRRIH